MSLNGADVAALGEIRKDDILIAFMGPTGVGKSTFIDLLTGQKNKRAGSSLKSCTDKVKATRVRRPGGDDRLVLIDTPGFDDTNKPDIVILQMIGDWLEKTYKKDTKLTGLVYLHRITDNRMAGSPLKNLRMFGELCGDVAMNQVMLVTTMWERVNDMNIGRNREKELVDKFWQPMIARGSKVERLSRAAPDAAWKIVDRIIEVKNERHAVLLQEELADLKLKLNETQAGQVLYDSLQKLLSDQKKALKAVLEQVNKSNDTEIAKELQAELDKIEEQFQKTFDQVKGLKITIGQRIKRFFSFKKAQARAVKIGVAN